FIRRCRPAEYASVGRMIAEAYAGLSGMPQATEQPEYYALLLDVGRRDRNPYIRVYVAVDELDQPIGSVDFIEDMSQYGSGGSAGSLTATAGIRLLAVAPAWRQAGVGKTLIRLCIEQARAQRKL